jgi:hypothetical protein
MGAKTNLLAIGHGQPVDLLRSGVTINPDETLAIAGRLFPGARPTGGTGSLGANGYTTDADLYLGSFGSMVILSTQSIALDRPSQLPEGLRSPKVGPRVYLHAMHSVVDWFAFAVWTDGALERSLSISGGDGEVLEDIGPRVPVEEPYWEGEHLVDDDYPFPFHPLELGETVLKEQWGFQIEGIVDPDALDPYEVPLLHFTLPGSSAGSASSPKRRRSWFRR